MISLEVHVCFLMLKPTFVSAKNLLQTSTGFVGEPRNSISEELKGGE